MHPCAQSDGHDAPGLVDKAAPSVAAVVEDVGVGFEDLFALPVVAHEQPQVLDRVEFWQAGRLRQQGDVGGHRKLLRRVPPRLDGYQCL